jgi:3-oxoacyl-[acyl-carrier protein] reductase
MTEKPVAIVTGGARGIGAACCHALAKEGFRIGISDLPSSAEAAHTLAEIGDGFLLPVDLADTDQVEKMLTSLKDLTNRVDVLVNNVGLSVNADINSMKMEQFDLQRALMRGTWYLTKRIIRLFMQRSGAYRKCRSDPLCYGKSRYGRLYQISLQGVERT